MSGILARLLPLICGLLLGHACSMAIRTCRNRRERIIVSVIIASMGLVLLAEAFGAH